MIMVWPTDHPGAFSIECATGGHSRCRGVACQCLCHVERDTDADTDCQSDPWYGALRFMAQEEL